jgi:TRAP-type mannitol/chloroaromatic compound transport system permease small subunit
MEVSPEPDGLPFVYLQKSLLVVLAVFLSLQSLSEIIKSAITLRND